MSKHKEPKARVSIEAAPRSFAAYSVDMTSSAEMAYKELHRKAKEAEKAGDYGNIYCTTFRMVQDVIKRVIPGDPLNKKYALRDQLSNIFQNP